VNEKVAASEPADGARTGEPRAGAAAVLAVDGLTVRYGGTLAVEDATLHVEGPGITALVGPSGCGKTSLLRAVAGFEVPAAGTVRLGGRRVAGGAAWLPPEARRVGMVFQEGALFPHLTVLGNVLFGLERRPDARRRAVAALALVHLTEQAGRFPDQLSGGQQQRAALARALAPGPQLVLLDEPFASLDPGLRQQVREEVRGILAEAGATAVLVTHDQEEALSVADRVAVMAAGRVLQVGTPEEVYHHPACETVARFVGEGQVVDCEVRGGLAHCAFGAGRCGLDDGPGRLLLRPEDLRMVAASEASGPLGTVARRSFFGHDLLDEVTLAAGGTVRVRSLASEAVPLGAQVRLTLRDKTYRVFR
jgi:iron(III) transport system ATP-binding protein